MGKLAGAYSRDNGGGSLPELKTKEEGEYRAFWIGMSDPVTEVSSFGDKCPMCKGAGTGRRGEPNMCIKCNGSGKKTEQYVTLRYHLENGNIEEEKVAYKLSDAGSLKDGSPRSPSKLFLRFRAFAQNPKAKPEDLDIWFSALPEKIKIPVRVDIEWNADATYLKIANVKYRATAAGAPAVREEAPPARKEEPVPVGAGGGYRGEPQGSFAGDTFDDDIPFAVDPREFAALVRGL